MSITLLSCQWVYLDCVFVFTQMFLTLSILSKSRLLQVTVYFDCVHNNSSSVFHLVFEYQLMLFFIVCHYSIVTMMYAEVYIWGYFLYNTIIIM